MAESGPFAGQTVLITGASRGIGAHLVERFRVLGASVVATARSIDARDEPRLWTTPLDVTDEPALRDWIRAAHRRSGRIDVLINNAGAASMNHSLLTPTQAIRDAVELNCIAAFVGTREAAKLMRKAHYGRIINLTTIAVPMLIEGELSYAASKAALETATRILAAEIAPFGITCNLVGPSPVQTDLIRGVPKGKMDALLSRLLLKRMATLDEVAHAVEVFADRRASHLTAQTLYLGGAH